MNCETNNIINQFYHNDKLIKFADIINICNNYDIHTRIDLLKDIRHKNIRLNSYYKKQVDTIYNDLYGKNFIYV